VDCESDIKLEVGGSELKGSVLFQDRDLSDLDMENPNYDLDGWDGNNVREEHDAWGDYSSAEAMAASEAIFKRFEELYPGDI